MCDRRLKRTALTCVFVFAFAVLIQAQGKKKNWAELMPSGEGKDIALTACTQCHGLGELVAQRLSAKSWQTVVADMAARGAQMLPGEAETLTAYLAQHYGPLVNVNQASAAELAKLPGLNATLADAIVKHRAQHGAFTKLEDLAAVAGLNAEVLEKLRDRVTTTEVTETKRKK